MRSGSRLTNAAALLTARYTFILDGHNHIVKLSMIFNQVFNCHFGLEQTKYFPIEYKWIVFFVGF